MKTNMGYTDRIIRIVIAVIIAVLTFGDLISGTLAIVLNALAGVLLLTSLIGVCPMYWPFGISTCEQEHTKSHTK